MNRKSQKTCLAGISTFLLMVLVSVANSAEAPQQPTRTTVAPSHPSPLANSHLHGAKSALSSLLPKPAAVADANGTKKKTETKVRPEARRWAYSEWVTLHRGLGTIRGEVHSGSGSPMANIRVALRSSTGKVLSKASMRHVTHTSSGGMFVMKHVRIGSYRARATKGKAAGHVGVHVSGGRTTTAMIKL